MPALDAHTPLIWALGLQFFAGELKELRQEFRQKVEDEPMEATLEAVFVAASLFYVAEHPTNPKVDTFAAALEYVTTSLSVGSTTVYPITEAGKLVAAMVMTAGPSLAANLLGPTRSERELEREREDAARVARDEALLSGLDPTALGAVYRGRAQFRKPAASVPAGKAASSSREAAKRQTIAERKAAELAALEASSTKSAERVSTATGGTATAVATKKTTKKSTSKKSDTSKNGKES